LNDRLKVIIFVFFLSVLHFTSSIFFLQQCFSAISIIGLRRGAAKSGSDSEGRNGLSVVLGHPVRTNNLAKRHDPFCDGGRRGSAFSCRYPYQTRQLIAQAPHYFPDCWSWREDSNSKAIAPFSPTPGFREAAAAVAPSQQLIITM